MTSVQHIADLERASEANTARSESAWLYWLNRIIGPTRYRARLGRAARAPVYRITRVGNHSWAVERPGAPMEHAYPDLEQAVAFIRHECLYTPATVELRVGDLYVVAQLDPYNPSSLFGESVS